MLFDKRIDALLVRYPFIHCALIGRSHMGRPIYALEINGGSNACGAAAKRFFFNAAHHANEWITALILLNYLEEHAEQMRGGGASFFFVPVVNPDGVSLLTGDITPGSEAYEYMQSLCRPDDVFPDCWKANAAGVDLNSNYPAGWWEFKNSRDGEGFGDPGPRGYVGPYPLSEPESSAVAAYTRGMGFDATLSFHTQGEVVYWRYQNYRPPGAEELAEKISAASGYALENVPDESAHAGYKDWFIQEFNRPGFTIECGFGENPLPLSQFDRMYYDAGKIMDLFSKVGSVY
jgi:g-D-glutamyl-meso-diaminopimelate peptidase